MRVFESNFSNAEPLRALPAAGVVQVFCTAPAEVILERYAGRRRHRGHLDAEILEELRNRLDAGEWHPLDLAGDVIEVDTSADLDLASLAESIRTHGR